MMPVAMLALVALWSAAEASVFFLVADVPISWIGMRWGTRQALAAALVAAPMAALGGLCLAFATDLAPDAAHRVLLHIPGIGETLLSQAHEDWTQRGFRAMLAGSFSGVPYKLFAYAAARDHLPLSRLFALSVAARLPRFALVAAVSSRLGQVLRPRLRPAHLRALCLGFWLVFYAGYFWAMRQATDAHART